MALNNVNKPKQNTPDFASVTNLVNSFVNSIQSLDKINKKNIRKNVSVLKSVVPDIIKFVNIGEQLSNLNVHIDQTSLNNSKIVLEHMTKTISVMKEMSELKVPSMMIFYYKLSKFRNQLGSILNIFFGKHGIIDYFNALDFTNASDKKEVVDEKTHKIFSFKRKKTIDLKNTKTSISLFEELVDSTIGIVKKTSELGMMVFKASIVQRATLPLLKKIIRNYIDLLDNRHLKKLTQDSEKNSIIFIEQNIRAIFNIIKTVSSLDEEDEKNAKQAEKVIHSVLLNMMKIIKAISRFSERMKAINIEDMSNSVKAIKGIVDSMLFVIGEILLLAISSVPLAYAFMPALISIIMIGGFIRTVMWTVKRIGRRRDYSQTLIAVRNIEKIVRLMVLMVGEILVAFAIIAMAAPYIIMYWKSTAKIFAVIALAILAIARLARLVEWIIRWGGNRLEMGLFLIMILIGDILITCGALLLLGYMGKLFFKNNIWLAAMGMFIIVSGVITAISILGYMIMLMIPGIEAFALGISLIALSILAMLIIGKELLLLTEFEFDQDDREAVRETTKTIIGASMDVIDAVFNGFDEEGNIIKEPTDDHGRKIGLFRKVFRSIFKGSALIVEALATSVVLVLTVVSVTMTLILGAELQFVAQYKIDRKTVEENVSKIMNTAEYCIYSVFEDMSTTRTRNTDGSYTVTRHIPKRTIMASLHHFFSGLANILELVVSVGKLAVIMISIGLIRLTGETLKWVTKFDTTEVSSAGEKAASIMKAANACVEVIFNPNEDEGNGKKKKTRVNRGNPKRKLWRLVKEVFKNISNDMFVEMGKTGVVLAAISLIVLVAKELDYLAKYTLPEDNTIVANAQNIISTAKACADIAFGEDIIKDSNDELNTKLEKFGQFANSVESTNKAIVRIYNSINNIDAVKLGKAARILTEVRDGKRNSFIRDAVEYMKDISQNSFDIKRYNENVHALDTLVTVLDKFVKVGERKGFIKYKEGLKDTEKFLKVINDSNLNKLETAYKLFKEIADISKSINGNFQGLADTINYKLVRALNNIKSTLDQLQSGEITVKSEIVHSTDLGEGNKKAKYYNAEKREWTEYDPRWSLSEDLQYIRLLLQGSITAEDSKRGAAVHDAK